MRHLPLLLTLLVCGCSTPESSIFTLYRNSVTTDGDGMRIHVSTFDAAEGSDYNRKNCDQAKTLFQEQPMVKVKFWCEKGRFKK